MDETTIYLDSPDSYTYTEVGEKRVKSVTTGNERTRISVAFTATSSGYKLKPLLLIPKKKTLKDFTPPNNVIVVYGTKGTLNDVVISKLYLTRIIEPFTLEKNIPNMSLIIDQAPCHLTKKVNIALFSRKETFRLN